LLVSEQYIDSIMHGATIKENYVFFEKSITISMYFAYKNLHENLHCLRFRDWYSVAVCLGKTDPLTIYACLE
jgi:hypothetical protein